MNYLSIKSNCQSKNLLNYFFSANARNKISLLAFQQFQEKLPTCLDGKFSNAFNSCIEFDAFIMLPLILHEVTFTTFITIQLHKLFRFEGID